MLAFEAGYQDGERRDRVAVLLRSHRDSLDVVDTDVVDGSPAPGHSGRIGATFPYMRFSGFGVLPV
ncbi:hypothetical protein ACQP2F_37970 [Actinoplanes sp. CA-030573]|uniref:hypothetical protein n=1 Tax=Actinoplanes sp. CA-030573 TaxID=3239898 RepID=UPI003D8A7B0A